MGKLTEAQRQHNREEWARMTREDEEEQATFNASLEGMTPDERQKAMHRRYGQRYKQMRSMQQRFRLRL